MNKMLLTVLAALPLWAHATVGVIGVGNSNDLSLQLDFARQAAVSILAKVDGTLLDQVTNDQDQRRLYRACRKTMFEGALKTQFKLVDLIDDGQGYHALARREPGYFIEVSRRTLEQVPAIDVKPTFLVAMVIHEVGHDCRMGGQPIDDTYDAKLNALAVNVIAAGNRTADSYFLDMHFIQNVQGQKPVQFDDMSETAKRSLVDKYLDYVGDWIYYRNANLFAQRPAPASDFFADASRSWQDGWAYVDTSVLPADGREMVNSILRGSFDQSDFFRIGPKGQAVRLKRTVECKPTVDTGMVDCTLRVFWNGLTMPSNKSLFVEMRYTLNIFSEASPVEIHLRSRSGVEPVRVP